MEIRQIMDVRTRMRDGIQLSSDVWLPSAPGRYPVLLLRTPYTKTYKDSHHAEWGEFFADHGYAFVVQDVRGRGDSEGEFDFFFQESDDGYDAVEGLAREPWCNGDVGMVGVSYWGTSQWLAARRRPPSLCCIAPTSPAGAYLNELPAVGGAFLMQWALTYLNETSGHTSQSPNLALKNLPRIFQHRPLLTMDEALGRKMRLFREFLQNPTLNEYWKRILLTREDFEAIDIPVLTVTGQFDGNQAGALFYWQGLEAARPDRADDHHLVIGPWTHLQSFLGGGDRVGEIELPQSASIDNKQLHLAFFDRHLRRSSEAFDAPRVRVYFTGADEWREFDHYPVANLAPRRLFLTGQQADDEGSGGLTWEAPALGATDSYLFDPQSPVPFGWEYASDRRTVQERSDVLVYTSEELKVAVEVCGPVSVDLYAASDARDTDFTAAISDVYPDGRSVLLGSKPIGVIRARYRN
ncbi:MAG TPA: CocE/NonD family hydrolase, partial [Oscillatoriaceae cyanobacterium]